MFKPDELRDANGKWTREGLLRHGVTVGRSGAVAWRAMPIGAVVRRPGGYEARGKDGQRVPGPKLHASVAQASAHVAAAHFERGLATKAWVTPPSPTGVAGRKAGGLTAVGITNTELGDAVERVLAEHLGMEDAHPGRRQGPFDLRWDGHAFEVKAVSQAATEYKAKPKKHEVEGKLAHAADNGLSPHVMIVVYEPPKAGTSGKLYAYSKAGVGAYRLPTNEAAAKSGGWSFHGVVPINLGKTWDPIHEELKAA